MCHSINIRLVFVLEFVNCLETVKKRPVPMCLRVTVYSQNDNYVRYCFPALTKLKLRDIFFFNNNHGAILRPSPPTWAEVDFRRQVTSTLSNRKKGIRRRHRSYTEFSNRINSNRVQRRKVGVTIIYGFVIIIIFFFRLIRVKANPEIDIEMSGF